MKCTRIRILNRKPTISELEMICEALSIRLAKAGFLTDVKVINSTCIKIGQRSRSFSLDLNVHDRNWQNNPFRSGKFTNLPTWDQRVEFNDIVNRVFNKYKVSSKITSGPFTIRDGKTNYHESDWHDQKPEYMLSNECRGFYIEAVDVASILEDRRIKRNEIARERRIQKRRASMVVVS